MKISFLFTFVFFLSDLSFCEASTDKVFAKLPSHLWEYFAIAVLLLFVFLVYILKQKKQSSKRKGLQKIQVNTKDLNQRYENFMRDNAQQNFLSYALEDTRTHTLFPLSHGINSIGAGKENDIVLAQSRVENFHAQLCLEGQVFMIKDLGSASGIYVNDVKVNTKDLIRINDIITLGNAQLEFVIKNARRHKRKL